MQSIANRFLSIIDMFGVPVRLRTSQRGSKFKTWVGGILTLMIYSASLVYTIYMVAQWQAGNLLPRISNQVVVSSEITLDVQNTIIEFSQFDVGMNPFNFSSVIIVPLLYQELSSNGKILNASTRSILTNPAKIELTNIKFQKQRSVDQFVILMFVMCQPQYLLEGQQCADQNTIDTYLSNLRTYYTVRINLLQFDPQKNFFTSFYKDLYIISEPEYCILNSIVFSTTVVSHDNGLLLPSIQEHLIISDFSSNTQMVTKQYLQNLIHDNYSPLLTLMFQLDKLQHRQTVVRPKFGEIFADIGSIISVLMMIRVVAEAVSARWQDEVLLDTILRAYFSCYQEVSLTKNVFGRIKRVEWKSKVLDPLLFEQSLKSVKRDLSGYLEFERIIQKLIVIEKKLHLEDKVILVSPMSNSRKVSQRVNDEEEIEVNSSGKDIEQIFC